MARLLTRPTLAITSPTRPESAKTASSPRDAPCPKRGRKEGAPFATFNVSRICRTKLADFFSILRDTLWSLCTPRTLRVSSVMGGLQKSQFTAVRR